MSVEHRCIGTQARVQWGGFEQNSGGIVIEGVLYEPKADITVDAAVSPTLNSNIVSRGALKT